MQNSSCEQVLSYPNNNRSWWGVGGFSEGQDSQLKGKSLRRSLGNRTEKDRDGDETLPGSIKGSANTHKVAPAMWCRNPLEVASQLLVPNEICSAPGSLTCCWRAMGSCSSVQSCYSELCFRCGLHWWVTGVTILQ